MRPLHSSFCNFWWTPCTLHSSFYNFWARCTLHFVTFEHIIISYIVFSNVIFWERKHTQPHCHISNLSMFTSVLLILNLSMFTRVLFTTLGSTQHLSVLQQRPNTPSHTALPELQSTWHDSGNFLDWVKLLIEIKFAWKTYDNFRAQSKYGLAYM